MTSPRRIRTLLFLVPYALLAACAGDGKSVDRTEDGSVQSAEAGDVDDASSDERRDGGYPEDAEAIDADTREDGAIADDASTGACGDDAFELAFNTPDPTRAVFDPNEVAVVGRLEALVVGSCDPVAVAPVTAPNRALTGFGCSSTSHVVRPSDGRLLYLDVASRTVRVFACDGCTYAHPQDRYPYGYAANDEVIATPGCSGQNPLLTFLLSPEGRMIHRCENTRTWYDEAGAVVLPDAQVSRYGVDGWLLIGAERLYAIATGASVPIQGLPADRRQLTQRATASGFQIVTSPAAAYDPAELWEVSFDGTATRRGMYPDAPPGLELSFLLRHALDADGRLYQVIPRPGNASDVIVRRTLGGPAEIVYDELDAPLMRLNIPDFVSGPGPLDASKRHAWAGEITEPLCPAPDTLWTYTTPSTPPPPTPVAVPIAAPVPGPGVPCGSTRCSGGTQVCCSPRPGQQEPPSCKANPGSVPPGNTAPICFPTSAYAACDQSSDCAGPNDDSNDPAVCCFTASFGADLGGSARECTTARRCAGSAQPSSSSMGRPFVGVLACQEDADCALAAQPSRCINDGVVTSATDPQAGRCEGVIVPPDGTTLLAASVLCGDAPCGRDGGRTCCHTGEHQGTSSFGAGVLTMNTPQCTASCPENVGSQGPYASHGNCDEPADCRDPAAPDPANARTCCFVNNVWGGPWHRECQPRPQCRVFACQTDADCAPVGVGFTCRPERTLTGNGVRRPEVRSCQAP